MGIDYYERIPNNIGLGENRALQRALEQWQPRFLDWWREMGPAFGGAEVYLRTATAVDDAGWATYGHVRMPEYRWGIFLADPVPDRRIGFGDAIGEPVWQQVPGEHRSALRRLIVTQGDTEPASVEQQRLLGLTCPSLYDLRNLFQVNVEEGRHLWAMVYLLHAYFGRDGREEAEEMLTRHSGDPDRPRILGTFNEPIEDWLSFLMFTYFTDRDGSFQLKSLAESAFDPLSRSCRFMLTEEAFHMFVGTNGVTRVIRRTLDVMQALRSDDPTPCGMPARSICRPCSVTLISGSARRSTCSARKSRRTPRAISRPASRAARTRVGSRIIAQSDAYVSKCPTPSRRTPGGGADAHRAQRGDARRLRQGLRHRRAALEPVDRKIRALLPPYPAEYPVPPLGRRLGGRPHGSRGQPDQRRAVGPRQHEWLPSGQDRAFVQSLMRRVVEPGKFAGWIAPPEGGINNLGLEYEYVRAS